MDMTCTRCGGTKFRSHCVRCDPDYAAENKALREENARKDEALEWYADPENYKRNGCTLQMYGRTEELCAVTADRGQRARALLASARPAPAQAPEAKGESGEAAARAEAQRIADEYSQFITPVVMADLLRGDIQRALLARKPAEERGPEVGDLVMWSSKDRKHRCFGTYNPDVHAVPELVLMRRGEVEARVKGESK